MSRRKVFDFRNDFRGGRNTTNSPDLLNSNELVDSTNARLSIEIGGIVKRTGSRRMHTTAIGAGNYVAGLTQWDSPTGKQIVAICGGDLYYKTTELGEFTQVDPGPTDAFSTTSPAYFAPFRASSSGAPLVLFIASGGKFYRWTGTALLRLDTGVYQAQILGDPENFNNWTATGTPVRTAGQTDPLGGTEAYLLADDDAGVLEYIQHSVTYTGDGEKAVALFVKEGTISGTSRIGLFSVTAGVMRHRVTLSWPGGVPLLSTTEGSGTLFPVENWGNGWWRIAFSATGVVAADTNAIRIAPTTDAAGLTTNLYIFGANTWNASTPNSYQGPSLVRTAPLTDMIVAYHTRMFAHSTNFLKSIIWSVLGDAEDYTVAIGTGGGQAYVDVLSGEKIVALEVIGSSLLMAAEDSTMRFTGHSSDDIIIAQDTEGVSADIGVVGPLAIKRVENVVFGLAERGPHIITEQTVYPIGVKVEEDFDALDRVKLSEACIGYHKGRREVWFAVPGPSDSAQNKTVYVYSTRLQAWSGPFTYPFGIFCFSRYEDANGDEWLIAGCTDGRVRHMDTGAKDDVLADASGGTNYTMSVELAPMFFNGPNTTKQLRNMFLQADLPAASAVQVQHDFDLNGFITTPAPTGTGFKSYLIDLHNQGKRLKLKFTDASADIPVIYGFTLEGWFLERTY